MEQGDQIIELTGQSLENVLHQVKSFFFNFKKILVKIKEAVDMFAQSGDLVRLKFIKGSKKKKSNNSKQVFIKFFINNLTKLSRNRAIVRRTSLSTLVFQSQSSVLESLCTKKFTRHNNKYYNCLL